MPMDNTAIIEALEQARAALDDVEAAAAEHRRDKAKMPPMPAKMETEDDAAEME